MVKESFERLEQSRWGRIMRISAILSYLAFFLTVAGPLWLERGEPYFFPVITPAVILDIKPVGLDDSIVTLTTERLRECNFERIVWYVGNRGGTSSRMGPVKVIGPPKTREKSENIVVSLKVAASPEVILTSSYANVHYKCHWWQPAAIDTVMPLYDGNGQGIQLSRTD